MILDPNGVLKCFGGREAVGKEDALLAGAAQAQEKIASFLVFRAGAGAPKAVPLELVSRLEVVAANTVELSGHDHVVQYRGELMRLKTLPGEVIPTEGEFDVVVFTYDNRTIGLVVDSITDIVEAPLDIKLASSEEHFLGSILLLGKTTDVVDVGYLLKDLVSDLDRFGTAAAKVSDVRVLLVEDSVFFRKLIVPFLRDSGYIVTEAGDGYEALKLVDAHKAAFDIVITDIEMPEMDGFELATHLRADSRLAAVPILAFTSTVNDIFQQRALKVGMNDIILKTDREALVLAMHRQLNNVAEVA